MDCIFYNGNFLTMDKALPRAQAVAVQDGRFAMVGSNAEVLALQTPGTRLVDLQGQTAVPGFNESHIHLLNYAYSLSKVDAGGCGSIEEMITLSRAFLQRQGGEGWLLGRGWNDVMFNEGREPTAADLDRISTEVPICFTRICEHICVANSKAMELAGVKNGTADPAGGHYDRDESGNPTGIFRENARYMIYDIIPDVTVDDIKRMLLQAAAVAASYGITSVQSEDFEALPSKDYDRVIKAYTELAAQRQLPVRVYQQCLLPEPARLEAFLQKYTPGAGDAYYRIGPLKLLTDGSLGARTAFLNEPYSDAPATRGISVFSQKELNGLVCTAHKAGMQIVLHAIGDAAMEMCLESFRQALDAHPASDPRFGIIHLQITTPDIIRQFKELNVIAYEEPISLNNDIHMVESRVGARAQTAYNYRDFFENDIPVAISSDCPVDSLNPMKNIYVAVNRMDYNGYPAGGWRAEQSLSVEQSLYAFTMGSAYASFEEGEKGSITQGKLADFAVLSDDICAIEKEKIQDIEICLTVMDGNITYQRP